MSSLQCRGRLNTKMPSLSTLFQLFQQAARLPDQRQIHIGTAALTPTPARALPTLACQSDQKKFLIRAEDSLGGEENGLGRGAFARTHLDIC